MISFEVDGDLLLYDPDKTLYPYSFLSSCPSFVFKTFPGRWKVMFDEENTVLIILENVVLDGCKNVSVGFINPYKSFCLEGAGGYIPFIDDNNGIHDEENVFLRLDDDKIVVNATKCECEVIIDDCGCLVGMRLLICKEVFDVLAV